MKAATAGRVHKSILSPAGMLRRALSCCFAPGEARRHDSRRCPCCSVGGVSVRIRLQIGVIGVAVAELSVATRASFRKLHNSPSNSGSTSEIQQQVSCRTEVRFGVAGGHQPKRPIFGFPPDSCRPDYEFTL